MVTPHQRSPESSVTPKTPRRLKPPAYDGWMALDSGSKHLAHHAYTRSYLFKVDNLGKYSSEDHVKGAPFASESPFHPMNQKLIFPSLLQESPILLSLAIPELQNSAQALARVHRVKQTFIKSLPPPAHSSPSISTGSSRHLSQCRGRTSHPAPPSRPRSATPAPS